MTIQETIIEAARVLGKIFPNSQREARLLLAHALNKSYEYVYLNETKNITKEEKTKFHLLIQRRLNNEPLSKIREQREFWSLPFRVTPDTLDPRPDTETLIEAILSFYPDKTRPWRILDLGTGTGCLLLSLLYEYPHAWGLGLDYSESACQVAKYNAEYLNLNKRANLMVGNWGQALTGTFDIIVSNPPYIRMDAPLPPEVCFYDPHLALYGGEDGLSAYKTLAKHLPKLTGQDTKIFLEIGLGQEKSVPSLFLPFKKLSVFNDLEGRPRCIVLGRNTISVK